MPRECLPDHLKDERHTDWLWPFSYIPRAWNAFCGEGPIWLTPEQKPIPLPGGVSHHSRDKNGARRPYYGRTFKNGFHFRTGYRWDDVDHYYNWVLFTAGFEYRNGQPV